MMIKKLILIALLAFISFHVVAQNVQSPYKIIYKADHKGKVILGSLDDLVNQVHQGNSLRVGWELKFKNPNTSELVIMQHWADAGFITTLNGHVFAQIRGIYQQGPSVKMPPSVFLVNGKPNGWVAILGTTGVMVQHYEYDEEMMKMLKDSGMTEAEITKMLEEEKSQQVITSWAVMDSAN